LKALIIGGYSGIGRASSELLKEQHPEIEQYIPHRATLDVIARRDIVEAIKHNGPFSHILYSAGTNRLKWIRDPTIDLTLFEAFNVNCSGFILVLGEHRRRFPDSGFSAVAVSSDAAHIPMRGSIAYCASKAALDAAVRVAARELAPHCRVNAVAPGMVDDTVMSAYIDKAIPEFRGWSQEYAREYEKQNTPTGRRATLAEVAETIVWVLTGPEQMTGAIININGGR
jgi:NAD(P)-dependent dehydrogenase (short-subunit alcohol dehydrogenase family)